MTPFVFVALLSNHCTHCIPMLQQWNTIANAVLQAYPTIQFPKPDHDMKHFNHPPIMVKDGVLNSYMYPTDLLRFYKLWTPVILLIPQESWIKCNTKLGPGNLTKLDNVIVMNAILKEDIYTLSWQYDARQPSEFVRWIKDSTSSSLPEVKVKVKKDKVCTNLIHLVSPI